jgi:hypothetical protein
MPVGLKLETSILDVLRYFSLFKFPLTLPEIHKFCSTRASLKEVKYLLEKLVESKSLTLIENCYLLVNLPGLVVRKRKGAEVSKSKIKEARFASKVINAFPFVRMVGVSGSLSKGYFEEGYDIDFFIITSKNRLWICRSLLHLFKKLTFLIGKQHNYCMNYFIDESALKIEEENVFTAIELATLIPMTNEPLYKAFISANFWMEEIVPNAKANTLKPKAYFKVKGLKKVLETAFGFSRINIYFMNLTDRKWRKKWEKRGFDMTKYDQAFRTAIHISKNHPDLNEEKVLKNL